MKNKILSKNKLIDNHNKKLDFLRSSINQLKKTEKNSNSNLNLRSISNELNTKLKEKTLSKENLKNSLISKNNLKNLGTNESNKVDNKYKFSKITKKKFLTQWESNKKLNKYNKSKNKDKLKNSFQTQNDKIVIKSKNYIIKCKFIKNYTVVSYNKFKTIHNRISIFHNQILINNKKKQLNFFAIYESKLIDLLEFYKKYFHKIIFEIKDFHLNLANSVNISNNKLLRYYENNEIDKIQNYMQILNYQTNTKNNYNYDQMIDFKLIIMIDSDINFITNNTAKLLISKNTGNTFSKIENNLLCQKKSINLNTLHLNKTNDFIILRNKYLETIQDDKNIITEIWNLKKYKIYNELDRTINELFNNKNYINNVSFIIIELI